MAEMNIPGWLKETGEAERGEEGAFKGEGFIDRTLENIASFMREALDNGNYARRNGVLQGIEPRARIAGMLFLIVASGLAARVFMLSAIIVLTAALGLFSGVGMGRLLKRVLPTLLFTSVIIAPVFFSFVTPGGAVLSIGGTAVTREGIITGLFIIARVGTMSALGALLLLTTGQADLFRGLRGLVPAVFVTALFMTFRYILILLRTAEDTALARKSRTITGTSLRESQGWFATRAGFILKKTVSTADEVTLAMVSRGFDGKIKTFESPVLRGKDFSFIGISSFVLFLSTGL